MVTLEKKIIEKNLKRLTAVFSACLASCFLTMPALSQPFAPTTCDPQYYESLEARAWLESQREITQNQNLIFKSDSVLEYTCFDSHLSELVLNAGAPTGSDKLFTATDRWNTPPAGDIAASLSNLVGRSLGAYDSSNFDHNLLGGRGSVPYNLQSTITSGSYACNTMNEVWKVAKCMDFIDQPSHDGFFTFAEYAADPDKRALPSVCSNKGPYSANIGAAVINNQTPWHEDDLITYFDYIYPPPGGDDCGGNAQGHNNPSMIVTGLIVETSTDDNTGVTRYAEKICVVPGCYFKPTADYPSTFQGNNPTSPPDAFDHNTSQSGRCCSYNSPCP